ncbi:MAG: hypothetical protein FWD94_03795, partial [Treponema sp.]|nr:hypothetical protein [Treponema sp.]
SMERQWARGHFVAASRDGKLVVIGVASRGTSPNREGEIEVAKIDAARKVAMFHQMAGKSEHMSVEDQSGVTVNSSNSLGTTVDHEQFIELLRFDRARDVVVHDGGTLVRFTYEAKTVRVGAILGKDAGGRPVWTRSRNLPEIPGYTVAVGFAQTSGFLRDTVMRSAENAAARIIASNNTVGELAEYLSSEDGYFAKTLLVSEGKLEDFRILEFWIEPEYGHVYTLAIARFVR